MLPIERAGNALVHPFRIGIEDLMQRVGMALEDRDLVIKLIPEGEQRLTVPVSVFSAGFYGSSPHPVEQEQTLFFQIFCNPDSDDFAD